MLTDSYTARCEICEGIGWGLLREDPQEEQILCLKHEKQYGTLLMKKATSLDVHPQWHKPLYAVTGT
jgi:hypothetical protein